MKLKGINIGGWLVLEKWMKPSMFSGTEAEDELFLCLNLSEEEKRERYRRHRESFITEEDFTRIAEYGFNAVRIPVPYFLFEDMGQFIHCHEYLDRAFEWADRAGLKILIDLHTVPGGQNGTDNSGICGVCTWSTKQENIDVTLDVLEKIAERYGREDALWGIEVINEPMCSDTPIAGFMNIQNLSLTYHPADPEMAKDNTNYPLVFLQNFYRQAYTRIRKHMSSDKAVVFPDAYWLEGWKDFFAEEQFENIVLDTHQYIMMYEVFFGEDKPFSKYEAYLNDLEKRLAEVSEYGKVIVGEWNLTCAMNELRDTDEENGKDTLRKLEKVYHSAVNACEGCFYWTYKLDDPQGSKNLWDVRKCIKNDLIRMEEMK